MKNLGLIGAFVNALAPERSKPDNSSNELANLRALEADCMKRLASFAMTERARAKTEARLKEIRAEIAERS